MGNSETGLGRLAGSFGAGGDLTQTLRAVVETARAALRADRATLYVIDVDTQLVTGLHTTETDAERRAFLGRSVGIGAAEMPIWRLQLADPNPVLVMGNVRAEPAVTAALRDRLGSGALLGVRLEHASVRQGDAPALLGTLFASYRHPRRFSGADIEMLRGFAGLATLTLANVRLQDRMAASLVAAEGLAAEQAALRHVAMMVASAIPEPEAVYRQTAAEVSALLSTDLGLVARFESGRAVPVGSYGLRTATALSLGGGGALAEVARTGDIARVDSYRALAGEPVGRLLDAHGYRSGVAVPVRVDGQLWGALLAATKGATPISDEAESRLERFAELVALAIANAEVRTRLLAQVATDPMTGIANHRTFFERMDAEVRRARRRGEPVGLAIIDVDALKQVNDHHGHLVGDAVLTELAARLVMHGRGDDTFGRIGGEQFAWLMPDTDARAAWLAAERARRAIAETPFPGVGTVTVSAGIAELREGVAVSELFGRADAALYWAKDHGRNLCVRFSPAQKNVLGARSGGRITQAALDVERLVEASHNQIGLSLTALSQLRSGMMTLRHVAGDAGAIGLRVGLEVPLADTYSAAIIESGAPLIVRDAKRGRRDTPAVARRVGVGAVIGVPVVLPDGEVYGTLCCVSRRAEPGLGEGDVRILRIVAGILGEDLERRERSDQVRAQKIRRVQDLLAGDGYSIVFQPIVDLSDGRVVAVEALSRVAGDPPRGPDEWFADAVEVGLGMELELMAIRQAVDALPKLPRGVRLSVNASPDTVCSDEFRSIVGPVPVRRLALEITEHAAVQDYDALNTALAGLRARGAQVMVDDAGAGFSSFKHILDLRPDVIKLDLSLSRDIDRDPLRRALAASVVAFADEIGATIVAEGIETPSELATLRELGVTHGQGYLLARPSPPPIARRVGVPAPARGASPADLPRRAPTPT